LFALCPFPFTNLFDVLLISILTWLWEHMIWIGTLLFLCFLALSNASLLIRIIREQKTKLFPLCLTVHLICAMLHMIPSLLPLAVSIDSIQTVFHRCIEIRETLEFGSMLLLLAGWELAWRLLIKTAYQTGQIHSILATAIGATCLHGISLLGLTNLVYPA
jgi:hypothetical protein